MYLIPKKEFKGGEALPDMLDYLMSPTPSPGKSFEHCGVIVEGREGVLLYVGSRVATFVPGPASVALTGNDQFCPM